MNREQILELANRSDDYTDQYLQSVGEYHPDWHSVRDEHFYHAAIQQYKDSLLKDVGVPVAYMTTDEEGSASMLFFDRAEALKYSGDDEPVNLLTESQLLSAVAKKDEEIAGMRKQIGKQAMTIGEYMDAERELQAAQEEWNQCSGLLDDAHRSIEMLEDQLAKAEQRVSEYNELIYAVQTKHHDETRHQTALRYIRNAENRQSYTAANGASS